MKTDNKQAKTNKKQKNKQHGVKIAHCSTVLECWQGKSFIASTCANLSCFIPFWDGQRVFERLIYEFNTCSFLCKFFSGCMWRDFHNKKNHSSFQDLVHEVS